VERKFEIIGEALKRALEADPGHSLPAMDLSSDILITRLREQAPIWSERFGVRSLRMFGSWARGTATPGSDVDLLVEFDGPATARRFYGLQLFLEDLLQQPIDLVTERALRGELRSAVEADAITL
jgi:predicted nucleotidyltransferase